MTHREVAISFEDDARLAVDAQLRSQPPGPSEVLKMVFVTEVVDLDSSPVAGFVPGYWLGPWDADDIGDSDVLGRTADGLAFYFWPHHVPPTNSYRVERTGSTFQLVPAD